MRHNLFLAFSALCLMTVACGPSKHVMQMEMRYPSKSGVDLSGKQVSVVYLEGGDVRASAFNGAVAAGFAAGVEKEHASGEWSVGVYRMMHSAGGNYSSRDSLVNLLMDTGADVVFLLDTVSLGTMTISGATRVASPVSKDSSFVSSGSIPFSIRMYSFDAMDKSGNVRTFAGSSTARPDVYSDGASDSSAMIGKAYVALDAEGFAAGEAVAETFATQWKREQYTLTYFDSSRWYDALSKASDYDWKGAVDVWISLLESKDMLKRSCAEYNIAIACLMLGDAELAIEWLDRSDADCKLPMSDVLRKRLSARL